MGLNDEMKIIVSDEDSTCIGLVSITDLLQLAIS